MTELSLHVHLFCRGPRGVTFPLSCRLRPYEPCPFSSWQYAHALLMTRRGVAPQYNLAWIKQKSAHAFPYVLIYAQYEINHNFKCTSVIDRLCCNQRRDAFIPGFINRSQSNTAPICKVGKKVHYPMIIRNDHLKRSHRWGWASSGLQINLLSVRVFNEMDIFPSRTLCKMNSTSMTKRRLQVFDRIKGRGWGRGSFFSPQNGKCFLKKSSKKPSPPIPF